MISIKHNQSQLINVNNCFSLFLLLFPVWHKELFWYVYISYFWWGWQNGNPLGASENAHNFFFSMCYFLYMQSSTNKGYMFFFFQDNLLWTGIKSCIVKSCNLWCHCNIETIHSNSNQVYVYGQLPIILYFHQI